MVDGQPLNLKPYSEREERQKLIQEVVNKLAGNKEAADMSKLLDLVKDPSNAELLLTLRNDKVSSMPCETTFQTTG